jgi:hypothetical protein
MQAAGVWAIRPITYDHGAACRDAMLKRLVFGALISLPLAAQRDSEYDHSVVKQVRSDLREPGYPPVDVIAPD